MNDRIDARVRRLHQQVAAFRKLHDDDLQLLIDELNGLAADLASDVPAVSTAEVPGDPAATSPKRAQWLAKQEKKSHVTRRDLLRGREEKP